MKRSAIAEVRGELDRHLRPLRHHDPRVVAIARHDYLLAAGSC